MERKRGPKSKLLKALSYRLKHMMFHEAEEGLTPNYTLKTFSKYTWKKKQSALSPVLEPCL